MPSEGRFARRLLLASHPAPGLAVTALATALAASVDARPVRVGLAFLAGQLSVGWSNDWVDADRDRQVQRPDKPVVQGLPVSAVRTAAVLAVLACVPLSLALGVRAGAAHLVAVASAWAYNGALKATALSFAPYAVSFGLVPSVVTLALPEHEAAPWWATGAGALLGVGAHFANVLPDLEDDAATGVRGLPQRLGRTWASALAGVALVTATVLLAVGPGTSALGLGAVGVAVVVFGAGLALSRQRRTQAAFFAVIAVAAVDVGLLLLRGASLTGHG
jgi:4-hydroxybenzoate polyprenyltransferase